jgi:NAD dependent epimerase/dehydratase
VAHARVEHDGQGYDAADMSDLGGMRVLVTGAGGFIGSHVVEQAVQAGAAVRAYVHYNSRADWGHLEELDADVRAAVEVVPGEIQDPFSVQRAVADCDAVLHLAALIGIPYSYVAPQSYVETNVTGTLNVLEAARHHETARVVVTSTSETYGTARYTPIDEAHPLQGQSPYSASKIGADKMAESYARSFGLPVATLRPFNTYGPRQSLRAVIPTIISQAVSGDVVRLGSRTPVRDFTFVEDTARAFLAVMTAPEAVGQVLNAGNGAGITIGELANLILEIVGSKAEVVVDERRVRPEASEVFTLLADASRIRELTGWAPQVSLRDGLERTAGWVEGNLARLKPELYNV